jgi:photosynthetic reaction center H subunit
MPTGAITGYIDVAQLTLYAFWIFFAGLIFYLRREDKREGYPLQSVRSSGLVMAEGFPPMPSPKVFHLSDGHVVYAPRVEPPAPPAYGEPIGGWQGAPLDPIGNPMVQGVGPASYVVRYLEVAVTVGGVARDVLVPMTLVRINSDYGHVVVSSVMGAQFAEAPVLANPDQITLREEDRVSAYFAGGQLYASADRLGPLL